MIALFLNSILVLSLVQAHYAPHVSRDMPWFEGWYTRITTDTTSIGFIVGQYNPMNNASLKET